MMFPEHWDDMPRVFEEGESFQSSGFPSKRRRSLGSGNPRRRTSQRASQPPPRLKVAQPLPHQVGPFITPHAWLEWEVPFYWHFEDLKTFLLSRSSAFPPSFLLSYFLSFVPSLSFSLTYSLSGWPLRSWQRKSLLMCYFLSPLMVLAWPHYSSICTRGSVRHSYGTSLRSTSSRSRCTSSGRGSANQHVLRSTKSSWQGTTSYVLKPTPSKPFERSRTTSRLGRKWRRSFLRT